MLILFHKCVAMHHDKLLLCICALALVSSQAVAEETPTKRISARKLEKQVRRLARDFLRYDEDLDAREQLVDRALNLGPPFVMALREPADLALLTQLRTYKSGFYFAIDKAIRIEPELVVDSNVELRNSRAHVVRLASLSDKLRDFLGQPRLYRTDREADQNSDTTDKSDVTAFESCLMDIEQTIIDRWLVAKGYRQLTPTELAVFAAANRQRIEEGLEPLEIDYKLCVAARDHSLDMTRRRFFSHTSKVTGKKTFRQRATRFGATADAENIANCQSPAEAMSLWMASLGHERNILDTRFRRVGIGHVGRKYTMMFGR